MGSLLDDKGGFSLFENVSGKSPIVLKVFQLSLGKSAHTFRYLEHVIWMPRSFGNKQNKNILPTKPPCPSGRKRVNEVFWLNLADFVGAILAEPIFEGSNDVK